MRDIYFDIVIYSLLGIVFFGLSPEALAFSATMNNLLLRVRGFVSDIEIASNSGRENRVNN